nr:POTRA domain-containing protein [uncultured Paludibaculum sp.]
MRSFNSVLAQLMGLFLLRAEIIPAQATEAQGRAPSSTQGSPFEAVPEPPRPPPVTVSGPAIVAIEFRGATRLRESVLRALIASRVGGPYDIETLRRDAQALKHTGRFSDVVWETEESRSGPIVRFVVVERPVIQSVEYQGNDTVTVPEILERFRLRKVNLRVETLFNEDELERAAATVRELVAERGHQNITVSPSVEPVWPPSGVRSSPPSTVKIIFRAEEQR